MKRMLHTVLPLLRVLSGVLSAAALGVLLAAACTRWKIVDAAVAPLLTVIKSTPVASFTILVLLWLRRELAPALIAGLIVLPVVWANVAAGIRGIDPKLLELAEVCRLGRWRTLQRVALARTLALGGDLLLDEPFKALDEVLRLRVIDAVSEAAGDAAILLVTHDRAEAERLGCRIIKFDTLTK